MGKSWDDAVRAAPRRASKYPPRSLGAVTGEYRQSDGYRRLANSSKRAYESGMSHLHKFAEMPIDGLKTRHVYQLMEEFSDIPAMANTIIAVLGNICQLAVRRGYIDTNPVQRIERFKTGEHPRWTDEEIAKFYTDASEPMRRILVAALYTGQRRGDLWKMKWSDIRGGHIAVTQQKKGAELLIFIHPTFRDHLAAWRATATGEHILTKATGKAWSSQSTMGSSFKTEIARIGIRDRCLHGLRKSAAALLAEAGCTTHQIASVTGHASLSEIERYTREAERARMSKTAMEAFTAPIGKIICNSLK